MPDPEISELEELGAEKVSGVGSPANGTPWLLLKGTDVQADPKSPHTKSPEADEQEDEMTKAEADEIEDMLTKARFKGFCGTDGCTVCKENFGPFHELLVEKAKLTAADRRALPKSAFVFPDKAPDSGSYPIHDESHARNALARSSGKPEAKAVRSKVHARYPQMGKSTGVPEESVKTPTDNGKINDGKSKLAGPMTDGLRPSVDPALTVGGQSSYEVPLSHSEHTNIHHSPPIDIPAMLKDLDDEIDVVDDPVTKDNWVSTAGWTVGDDDDDVEKDGAAAPSPAASATPGDGPWQAYDAATCDSVARGLAEAKIVLDAIRTREMTEAVSGNPSEWFDSYQLSCAMDDICSALGLVASLAYREAASGAEDSSAKKSITSTQSLLTDLVGMQRPTPAAPGDRTSEEETDMSTITKEDLTALVTDTAAKAATDAFAEMKAKQDKKDKKKAKKAAAARKAKREARKNANNGGDITAGDMAGKVHGKHEANDVNAPGTSVQGKYKNKSKKEAKRLQKSIDQANEVLAKMAGRPRSGGPVLDGQSRGAGASPASEGRVSEVTKGTDDASITAIADRLEKSTDPMERDQISRELTLARLIQGHERGII